MRIVGDPDLCGNVKRPRRHRRARNARKILNKTRSLLSVGRRGRAGGRFWALAPIFRASFHRLSFSTPPRKVSRQRRQRCRVTSGVIHSSVRSCPQRRHFVAGLVFACSSGQPLQAAGRHEAVVLASGLVQDVDSARIDLNECLRTGRERRGPEVPGQPGWSEADAAVTDWCAVGSRCQCLAGSRAWWFRSTTRAAMRASVIVDSPSRSVARDQRSSLSEMSHQPAPSPLSDEMTPPLS
jgi:hypothetical protein